MKKATHRRHDISNEMWGKLEPHLPGQRGQWGGIAKDSRCVPELPAFACLHGRGGGARQPAVVRMMAYLVTTLSITSSRLFAVQRPAHSITQNRRERLSSKLQSIAVSLQRKNEKQSRPTATGLAYKAGMHSPKALSRPTPCHIHAASGRTCHARHTPRASC